MSPDHGSYSNYGQNSAINTASEGQSATGFTRISFGAFNGYTQLISAIGAAPGLDSFCFCDGLDSQLGSITIIPPISTAACIHNTMLN